MPWYFAYGSNMQSATLRGRRGVEYRRACAGRVVDWRVVFDKPPLIGNHGAFGNLIEEAGAVAFGVAFEVDDDDLAHIELTEGVLIGNYERIVVAVQTIATMPELITAHSLSSPRRCDNVPTRRYMDLVIDGAIEHGLPEAHVASLRAVATCEESESSLQWRSVVDGLMKRHK
jgi:gamma-glutamylcyclotransferase